MEIKDLGGGVREVRAGGERVGTITFDWRVGEGRYMYRAVHGLGRDHWFASLDEAGEWFALRLSECMARQLTALR